MPALASILIAMFGAGFAVPNDLRYYILPAEQCVADRAYPGACGVECSQAGAKLL